MGNQGHIPISLKIGKCPHYPLTYTDKTPVADLMADLRKFIKVKKLTQAKAAEILGVSQSRVSDLTRGKWERFSLEMLIILATRAGMHVTLKTAA